MDRDNEIDLIQTIQKKDKVIDLMAREFYAENIYIGQSNFFDKSSPEKIKQHFYKIVEEAN